MDMSAPESTPRPERKRAAVPTYNLKVLSGIAKRSPKVYRKQTPSRPQSIKRFASETVSTMSSPLSSPPSSALASTPKISLQRAAGERPEGPKLEIEPANPSKHGRLTDECFNMHVNARGHYYSATELYKHGVWVGYLAPDRQNESYRDLPSYSELKTNCDDMDLPFPPGTASSSAKNRYAICGGCLSEQSSLLTLREVKFVHKKNLVIMPLDGDDEIGLFCILLPQRMDRSMKNIEAWRPYEVRNEGDGQKFDNNFVLYTLRYTGQDVGTKDIILAALESRNKGATSESHLMSASTGRVVPKAVDLEDPYRALAIPPAKKQPGNKRKARKDRVMSGGGHKRQRTVLQTPSSSHAPSALTREQAQNLEISWVFQLNGESYDISLLMSDCQSFPGMLDAFRRLAGYILGAPALLESAKSWSFSYTSTDGVKKSRIAHKDTAEGAFEKMRTDLAQCSLASGGMREILIKVLA